LATVVVAAPLLMLVPEPVAGVAFASSMLTPLNSAMRTSTYAAAALNVTVTVLP
jgi:hypothetical protein